MSLNAKVAYTFLLNRFQLPRRNGWTNGQGYTCTPFVQGEHLNDFRTADPMGLAEGELIAVNANLKL